MNYVNPNFGSGYKAYLELKEKLNKLPQTKLEEISEKMNKAFANVDEESKNFEEYYPEETLESGKEEIEVPQADESEKAGDAIKQELEEILDKQEDSTEVKSEETTETAEETKPKKRGRKKKVTVETSDEQAEA
jgi:hypothetical protein